MNLKYLAKFPLTGSDIDRSISLLDLDVLAEVEEDPEINAWSTQAIKFLRSAFATSAVKASSSSMWSPSKASYNMLKLIDKLILGLLLLFKI